MIHRDGAKGAASGADREGLEQWYGTATKEAAQLAPEPAWKRRRQWSLWASRIQTKSFVIDTMTTVDYRAL